MAANPKKTGPRFLTQCACFACRKAFKKDLADPRYIPTCPECHAPMNNMGRYFRAPKNTNLSQWRKVEMLFRAGVDFRSHEFGPLPKTVSEAKILIEANHQTLANRSHQRELARQKFVNQVVATEKKRQLARQQLKRIRASAKPEKA